MSIRVLTSSNICCMISGGRSSIVRGLESIPGAGLAACTIETRENSGPLFCDIKASRRIRSSSSRVMSAERGGGFGESTIASDDD